jgi:hypothetical protein
VGRVRKPILVHFSSIKIIILPRHARDKRRENSTNECCFSCRRVRRIKGTDRSYVAEDPTVNYLSYWTDNGLQCAVRCVYLTIYASCFGLIT